MQPAAHGGDVVCLVCKRVITRMRMYAYMYPCKNKYAARASVTCATVAAGNQDGNASHARFLELDVDAEHVPEEESPKLRVEGKTGKYKLRVEGKTGKYIRVLEREGIFVVAV